jgi:hypothetical protein
VGDFFPPESGYNSDPVIEDRKYGFCVAQLIEGNTEYLEKHFSNADKKTSVVELE